MGHLVGGVSSGGRQVPALDGVHFHVARAQGPYLWAAGGQRYIDTALGYGATLLGHSDPEVNDAVIQAVKEGSMPAFAHDGEERAAAALAEACDPLTAVIFNNSGSEAVHLACRIARAVTGRRTIAKIGAGFDGWFDPVAFGNAGSAEALVGNQARPERDGTTLTRYNDPADIERLFEESGDIAAVIVEPMLANAGCILADPDYLHHVQAVAQRHDALIIADEVLMGFRQRFGLLSHGFGLDPDIATVGKAIGNGFAVAAVLGRPAVMAAAADGRAARAGTYSGNPVATAAVEATLARLKVQDYPALAARGNRLRKILTGAVARHGEPATTSGFGMVFTPWFADRVPRTYEEASALVKPDRTLALHIALRRQGIIMMPQAFGRLYLSFAHKDGVIDEMALMIDAAVNSLAGN